MNPKPVFFTSDWHIGHANIIKYDDRPFRNVSHMREVLVNNYNSTVPENGICYFLGDIGFKGDIKSVISRLNGTKILIRGNHDSGTLVMYEAGFDVIMNGAILFIAGELVTLTHCPLAGLFREDTTKMRNPGDLWHGESNYKFKQYTIPNFNQFHLHGHIHSTPKNGKHKILGRQYDVGVAANNYRPVSISVIESWIAKERQTNTFP